MNEDLLTKPWRYLVLHRYPSEYGIYCESYPGQMHQVATCPSSLTIDEWSRYAEHICKLHNASLEEGEI